MINFLVVVVNVLAASAVHASSCKTYPGDAAWPSSVQWASLNSTINGRLISTIPIASVCHNGPLGSYDADACATVQDGWSKPWIHQDRRYLPR
jgi:hypothetical protein